MADLRLWSREVITEFLELYRTHTSLWDVKSEGYKNKYTKSLAYKDLVRYCKERGFPEANRDFVARKLQSLRGSFRKELRKIEKYKRAGKTYDPNLWYFNNLTFTIENNPEGDDHQTDEERQSGDDDHDDDNDGDDDEEKFSVEDRLGTEVVHVPTYRPESPPCSTTQTKKRRLPSEISLQPEFFDVGQETSKFKELSEFELTGMNIAKKLARMDEKQAIYAESLINYVIRKGLLKKLKEETDLCDNMCGKRTVMGVNLPSQSTSSLL